tara:strand:+ start:3 stop:746 length:744 start_codon:yes stop_codon:yes gene_type:complete
MSTLQEHFGREVKVYEIVEYGKTYPRLFYRSTGTSNEKFNGKFTETLFPFYGMEKDKNKTLIKAIMIRDNVYKKQNIFTWQVVLLQYLSKKTDSVILGDMQTLLENYFNTPGEIRISISDGNGFWKNNINIGNEIINFFKQNEYEIQDFDIINNDTYKLYNIENDKSILKNNWLKSIQIVVQKEQEERINEKIAAIKNKAKDKTKKGVKKTKKGVKKTKKGGKKTKSKTKKSVKSKTKTKKGQKSKK